MRRTFLLAAAVALTTVVGGTAIAAKPPTKGATLTIAVSPTPVTFGTYTGVGGAISTKQAGVALILQAQPYPFTGKWADAGTAATAADGAYTFSTLPALNTHYRVVTKDKPAVQSPESGVQVRFKVGFAVGDATPKRGARVRFRGTVRPALPNGAVYVQKHTTAGWKTVKQLTMRTGTPTSSTWSVRLRIKHNGRYRAVVMGNGALETGISRVRRIVVH
jgi:hypothetical protein